MQGNSFLMKFREWHPWRGGAKGLWGRTLSLLISLNMRCVLIGKHPLTDIASFWYVDDPFIVYFYLFPSLAPLLLLVSLRLWPWRHIQAHFWSELIGWRGCSAWRGHCLRLSERFNTISKLIGWLCSLLLLKRWLGSLINAKYELIYYSHHFPSSSVSNANALPKRERRFLRTILTYNMEINS